MISCKATQDISTWDGCLSSSDFYFAACAFLEKWKKFNAGFSEWSWIPRTCKIGTAAMKVDGYLALENILFPRSHEDEQDESSLGGQEEVVSAYNDELFDDAILVQTSGRKGHYYDFHVVYSPSYRVPVLYFRSYCDDGTPLALEEIQEDLSIDSTKLLMESKWTFITQEEHPYLNRPWYTLHPCGTSEWMKLLLASHTKVAEGRVAMEKYLVSWLSVAGQVFSLRIPLEMFSCS